jgi:[acyl-carrier-protein] S-malonyltransferase
VRRALVDAAARKPTGMTAVLGGDPGGGGRGTGAARAHRRQQQRRRQVVAAGTLDQLEAFKADPPAKRG